MKTFLYSFALALGLSLASIPSYALVTYSYVGNAFSNAFGPYTTSNSIVGSITFSSALGSNLDHENVRALATAFSFSDGVNTISNLSPNPTPSANHFIFSTDAVGSIVQWDLLMYSWPDSSHFARIVSVNAVFSGTPYAIDGGSMYAVDHFTGDGYNRGPPGEWVAAIPEPETYAMMLAGLGLLGLTARRRRQNGILVGDRQPPNS